MTEQRLDDAVDRLQRGLAALVAAMPHAAVVSEEEEVVEGVLDLMRSSPDLEGDIVVRDVCATVFGGLAEIRGEQAYWRASVELHREVHARHPEAVPAGMHEALAVPPAPADLWMALGTALLVAGERCRRPVLIDHGVSLTLRALRLLAAADENRLVLAENLAAAVAVRTAVAGDPGSLDWLDELVEMTVTVDGPRFRRLCLDLGGWLLERGTETADVSSLRSADTVIRSGLASDSRFDATTLSLIESLRYVSRARVALVDVSPDENPALLWPRDTGEWQALRDAHERVTREVVAAMAADLQSDERSCQHRAALAEVAADAGDLHWRRAVALRGPERGIEGGSIVVLPGEDDERVSVVVALPGEPAAEFEVNAAISQYVMAFRERPDRIPSDLTGVCQIFCGSADGMAPLALWRADELLATRDRRSALRAVEKLARALLCATHPADTRNALAVRLGEALVQAAVGEGDAQLPVPVVAIAILRRALHRGPDYRRGIRASLAAGLLRTEVPDADALDEAILLLRDLVVDWDDPVSLFNLASALHERFASDGEGADRDESVRVLRRLGGLATSSREWPELAPPLLVLYTRMVRDPNGGDRLRNEVIMLLRTCLTEMTGGDPGRPEFHSLLGNALLAGELSELNVRDAEAQHRVALELTAEESDDYLRRLVAWASALWRLVEHRGDLDALTRCSDALTRALAALRPGDDLYATALINRTNAALTEAEQTGRTESLVALLPRLREAVSTARPDDPLRAHMLSVLAGGFTKSGWPGPSTWI